MTGTVQSATLSANPPNWLLESEKSRFFWESLPEKYKIWVADNAEDIREDYGASTPQEILGLLTLGA